MLPIPDDPFPNFDTEAELVIPALEGARATLNPGLRNLVERALTIKSTLDEVDSARLPKAAVSLYRHVIAVTFVLYNEITNASTPYSGSGEGGRQSTFHALSELANNLAVDLSAIQVQFRNFVNDLKKESKFTARFTNAKGKAKGPMKAACDTLNTFHHRRRPDNTLAEDFQTAYAEELTRSTRMPFPQPTVDGVGILPDTTANDPPGPSLIVPQSRILEQDPLNSSPSKVTMPRPDFGSPYHHEGHSYHDAPEHHERPGSHAASIPPSSPAQSHSTPTYDASLAEGYESEEEERLRKERLKKKREKAAKAARKRREAQGNERRDSLPDDDLEDEYYEDYSSRHHMPRRPKESSPIPNFRDAGYINFAGARINGAFNDFSVYRS